MQTFPGFRTTQLDIHLCSIFTTLTAKKYSMVIFHDSFQIKANAFITSKQHNFNCQLQFINKLWFGKLDHFSLSVEMQELKSFWKKESDLHWRFPVFLKTVFRETHLTEKIKLKRNPKPSHSFFVLQNFCLKSILLSNPQQEESWQTFLKHQGRISSLQAGAPCTPTKGKKHTFKTEF